MRIVSAKMNFLLIVLSGLSILLNGAILLAEPAPPYPVTLTQLDGTTFQAVIQGDEYYRHIETVEGFTIIKESGNWYYVKDISNGDFVSSKLLAGKDDPRSQNLPKYLKLSQERIEEIRNRRLEGRIEIRTAPLDPAVPSFDRPLIILADFDPSPYQHQYTRSQFNELLFSDDIYPTGSMNDYFQEVSYGNFSFIAGLNDVTEWTLASESYAWYCDGESGMGSWPQNSQGLLVDLAYSLDPIVDFSRYDTDGDGFVDAITLIVEGEADGSDYNFWAHAWGLGGHRIQLDGVWISRYNLVTEQLNGQIHPIGTFCHEYGHVLGSPDLYDYDYSSGGIGYWGLMGFGGWNTQQRPSHFCAWTRILYGWIIPTNVTENLWDQSINKVEENPEVYRLWTNGVMGNEYFLVENRQPVGFDENLRGSGLLIWHIDDDQTNNMDENHKWVDLEEADGEDDIDYYNNLGDEGDPYPGIGGMNNPNHTFDISSYPNSNSYSGSPTQVAVIQISESGDPMAADLLVTNVDGIPTISGWGMIILALLLMAAGTVAVILRRRAFPLRENYN